MKNVKYNKKSELSIYLIFSVVISVAAIMLIFVFIGSNTDFKDALIIDVRSHDEFKGAHVQEAINIPHYLIARDISKHSTDKDKTFIVYCRTGNRSEMAKNALTRLGYTNVTNGGGYRDMLQMGFKSE